MQNTYQDLLQTIGNLFMFQTKKRLSTKKEKR